jgi:hypothetical protein
MNGSNKNILPMKNFTFIKTMAVPAIIMIIIFSGALFGQGKKVNTPSVNVTFQVNMTYQYQKAAFNPLVDFVDIAGTMNGDTGSLHMTASSSLVYEIVYTLDSSTIQEYKFRINGLWATSEFPGGPKRMYRVPNHADTVTNFFSDYEPGTVPVTFKCNMSYQIKMGRFNKADDYLDFAGTINNWGDYDVLFDRGNDSIYEFNINVDTDYIINQTKIQYRYRINGSWDNAETVIDHVARVQDTAAGGSNTILVWYNDQNPDIPAAPFAYNLSIQGNITVGESLTGSYTYEDVNSDPEGTSVYRWLSADSVTQINPDTISGATAVNYTPVSEDAGKYLAFLVTPVAESGSPLTGETVVVWSPHKVYGLGLNETSQHPVSYYPNPVGDVLTVDNLVNVEKIEIFSLLGQRVFTLNYAGKEKITINANDFKAGVYFIKIYRTDSGVSALKFIKN